MSESCGKISQTIGSDFSTAFDYRKQLITVRAEERVRNGCVSWEPFQGPPDRLRNVDASWCSCPDSGQQHIEFGQAAKERHAIKMAKFDDKLNALIDTIGPQQGGITSHCERGLGNSPGGAIAGPARSCIHQRPKDGGVSLRIIRSASLQSASGDPSGQPRCCHRA